MISPSNHDDLFLKVNLQVTARLQPCNPRCNLANGCTPNIADTPRIREDFGNYLAEITYMNVEWLRLFWSDILTSTALASV